ncbi:helix-turn-helix transcriptional regulator [Paenalkalicoccus suaedae]|uniref:Helix-turn-helix transcriptional regulator n=1 Tax=Paenalkalicoccus suaedae TaxID=2592382 RepID=A0A859FAE8_9BACI|nr:helix-turn-helix transcriptional regulator [Paenalkalicoccus suaedae]QKS69907.1 helix-turn-helix transcriptional regulator [Paenalkalicoccus suaedae]
MKDPLSALKKSLTRTVFSDMKLLDDRKQAIKSEIAHGKKRSDWDVTTIMRVLEAVQHEPKQGFDILHQLFTRDEQTFRHKEGELYMLLHVLENKEILLSTWSNEVKMYQLSKRGKKLLAKQHLSSKERSSLKQLIEEASM